MKYLVSGFVALMAVGVFAGQAQGALIEGQLGILSPAALTGDNPATGAPWAVGDGYRFAFHTSTTTTASSTDIGTYNAWVQFLANASPLGIGANDGVAWKAIGSTDQVDARDNTSTNPTVESGHAIFLLDGSTMVASDYADLWDGEVQNAINLTELGAKCELWPFTGTWKDGTKAPGHYGSLGALGATGVCVHQGQACETTKWVWRMWTGDPGSLQRPMYALSEPLAITPEPATMSLLVLGGLGLLRRRRRGGAGVSPDSPFRNGAARSKDSFLNGLLRHKTADSCRTISVGITLPFSGLLRPARSTGPQDAAGQRLDSPHKAYAPGRFLDKLGASSPLW